MSLEGFNTEDLSNPRGAWTDLDEVEARPDRAFVAHNVRIRPGRVRTRDGYVTALAVGGKVTSMHQWLTSSLNRLIYYEGTGVKMKDLSTGDAALALYTLSGRGASVSEAGDKAYIAVYTNAGLGAGQTRFVNPTIVGVPVDIAFQAPSQAIPVVTNTGAGRCIPGLHNFGYVVESRSGFPGYPAPVTVAGVHNPVPFTVPAGGGAVNLALTLTVSAPPVTVHSIMTSAENLNKWFYTGDSYLCAVAGPIPVSINISKTDEDLVLGTSADPNFNFLTQTQAGTGPFSPSVLVPYNRRLCYIVDNKVYISDIDDYEVVSEDRHVIQIPGKRRIVTGFPLRGSFYTLGPGWTYVSSDDGNDPRQWPVPQEVSGAIGTSSPTGVAWKTAGDYVWVAHESGLWLFNGQYSEKPISYQNSDFWRRINWAVPAAVQVRESIKEQCVYVAAPLDAATEPSHLLVWYFGQGMEPFTVDFNYDDFSFGTFSSMCMVQDQTTGSSALWLGPSASGNILKQSVGTRSDSGAGIISEYETGFALSNMLGFKRFAAEQLCVSGAGVLELIVWGMDRVRYAQPAWIVMSETPGHEYRQIYSLNDENRSLNLRTDTAGHYFDLISIRTYWKPYIRNL